MKLPSPRTAPASERTSPLKAISFSSSVPWLAASCSAMRPVRFRRSIASVPRLNFPVEAGQSIRPCGSRPRSSAMPLMVSSSARHSPRIKRAQAELDVELVGADLAEIVDAADHHRAQPQRRRRQQACVQRPGDAHRRTDHLAGFGLELRPELVPVDKIRADQRGYQRKDEGYRQSEQRRLHGVSPWARACWACGAAPYIETIVAKSQQCGAAASRRPPPPACRVPLEAVVAAGRRCLPHRLTVCRA